MPTISAMEPTLRWQKLPAFGASVPQQHDSLLILTCSFLLLALKTTPTTGEDSDLDSKRPDAPLRVPGPVKKTRRSEARLRLQK